MSKLGDELLHVNSELGLVKYVTCNDEEQKTFTKMKKDKDHIPEDVRYNENHGGFFRIEEKQMDITNEELIRIILFRQLECLRTIKAGLVFFLVLVVLAILIFIYVNFAV